MKTIFAVLATRQSGTIGSAIEKVYPTDHIAVAPGQWLVADEGTAQSVTEKLGFKPGGESALILAVSGYYGVQPLNVWEWIKSKWGSPRA